jgi:hypothetical protein
MNSSPKRNCGKLHHLCSSSSSSRIVVVVVAWPQKSDITHTKQTTAKLIPLGGSLPEKKKEGPTFRVKEEPPPPPFQPVTVSIGSRAHDTHVVIGWQNKRAIWKTLNLATSSLVWYLVFRTKFLSLAVQLIIGRQPIHTGVAAVATFSTYYAIGGFILSLSVQ